MPIFDTSLGVKIEDEKPQKICQWIDCPDAGSERKMKVCAKCTSVRYCSRVCQKSDWPEHRLYCRIPALLDLGGWMQRYHDLFRWTLIEALRVRTDPTTPHRLALWIVIERMDRMINGGLSPSPFLIKSSDVVSFESLAAFPPARGLPFGPSAESIAAMEARGEIGEGVIIFCVRSGETMVLRTQRHMILEVPPGRDSPGDAWKNIVKGVVNGEIPISTLSRMVEDGS
ncbi:hypothetical protein C8R43DRAFT_1007605 [Mycena crocata]|nr:hypothetical protein C8R43DRAFT_1007605 [Mycena crocata]